MDVSLKTIANPATLRTACLVLPVRHQGALPPETRRIDQSTGGQLGRLVKAEHFSGEPGKSVLLHGPQGVAAERVLLVGIGKQAEADAGAFLKTVRHALGVLKETGAREAVFCLSDIDTQGRDLAWQLQQTGILAKIGAYRYTRTLSKPAPAPRLKKLVIGVGTKTTRALVRTLAEGCAMGEGINVARELGNLPANICTPAYLASEARSLARRHDALSCKVLDEKQMEKLGMLALLSVAAGTKQPARLIVLEYRGAAKSDKPYVLVGKGITFDSGGISLKPGAAMDEMKFDMCGAASVLGTMATVAALKPRINVVGIVAASENLPSGTATKPGDVIRSMSGITIEILNTDAEGRLVLCDALTYA
jgi:leucyl aminopeptidase